LESVHEIRSTAADLSIDQEGSILPSLIDTVLQMRIGKAIRVFDERGILIYQNPADEDLSFLNKNLLSEEYEMETATGGQREHAVVKASYRLFTGETRVFQVSTPVPRTAQILQELAVQYALVFLVLVAMLSFVASFLSRRILSPVQKIAQYLTSLRNKPIKKWLPIPQKIETDFLGDIVDSTNTLIGHVQESNLFHEHLARSIAHEIRTPLTMMMGELETTDLSKASSKELEEMRERLGRDIMQIDIIVKTLLELAQRGRQSYKDEREAVAIGSLIKECTDFFESAFQHKVFVDRSISESEIAHIDADLFKVLIDNLLRNTVKHARGLPQARIQMSASGEDHLMIRVLDNGSGLSAELLEVANSDAAWDARLGVGLNLCKQICSKTGWLIRFENLAAGGLSVSIRIPRSI
jgi:signal transduction histidine kinase